MCARCDGTELFPLVLRSRRRTEEKDEAPGLCFSSHREPDGDLYVFT